MGSGGRGERTVALADFLRLSEKTSAMAALMVASETLSPAASTTAWGKRRGGDAKGTPDEGRVGGQVRTVGVARTLPLSSHGTTAMAAFLPAPLLAPLVRTVAPPLGRAGVP